MPAQLAVALLVAMPVRAAADRLGIIPVRAADPLLLAMAPDAAGTRLADAAGGRRRGVRRDQLTVAASRTRVPAGELSIVTSSHR